AVSGSNEPVGGQSSCDDPIRTPSSVSAALQPQPERGEPKSAGPVSSRRSWAMTLLKWALIFLVVSLVAALFGFTGISAASADIARVLFFIFLVIFVVLLVLGLMAGRRV